MLNYIIWVNGRIVARGCKDIGGIMDSVAHYRDLFGDDVSVSVEEV